MRWGFGDVHSVVSMCVLVLSWYEFRWVAPATVTKGTWVWDMRCVEMERDDGKVVENFNIVSTTYKIFNEETTQYQRNGHEIHHSWRRASPPPE